jgi:hypothetical protein
VSLNMPIIKLTDGSSGGGSVTSIKTQGWSYVPGVPGFIEAVKGINMGIPNLAAVLGPAVRCFPFTTVVVSAHPTGGSRYTDE